MTHQFLVNLDPAIFTKEETAMREVREDQTEAVTEVVIETEDHPEEVIGTEEVAIEEVEIEEAEIEEEVTGKIEKRDYQRTQ